MADPNNVPPQQGALNPALPPPPPHHLGMRVSGPCDNAVFFNEWLSTSPYYRDFFLENVHLAPFNGSWSNRFVPTAVYLVSVAVGHQLNVTEEDDFDTRAIAEMLAPFISAANVVANEGTCRTMLKNAVLWFITHQNILRQYAPNCTRDDYVEQGNRANYQIWLQEHTLPIGVPVDADWEVVNDIVSIPTPQAAVRILFFLVWRSNAMTKRSGLGYIVHMIVSTIKRGTVSQDFVRKIQRGVHQELGFDIQLSVAVINRLFVLYGGLLSSVNIGEVIDKWAQNIPQLALRLKLTVIQAPGTGLTSLVTIARMLKKYPSFCWDDVALFFPDEWASYTGAFNRVNGDVYFGYNHDLAAVKSTLYKSLGYIAKELARKVDGDNNIDKYKGWPNNIKQKGHFDTAIALYERFAAERVIDPFADQRPAVMPLPAAAGRDAVERVFGRATRPEVIALLDLVAQDEFVALLV